MNFINPDNPESDKELFFGSDEKFESWPGDTIAHIAVAMGSFPSLSQARKNGFDKPLSMNPPFQVIKIGKRVSWVLHKIAEEEDEH
jgi:hypothetical protein